MMIVQIIDGLVHGSLQWKMKPAVVRHVKKVQKVHKGITLACQSPQMDQTIVFDSLVLRLCLVMSNKENQISSILH